MEAIQFIEKEVPRKHKSKYTEVVEAFLESGMDSAVLDIGERKAKSVVSSFNYVFIDSELKEKVKIIRRCGEVYLKRI